MTEEIKQKLRELADKYENSSFLESDPSQFLHWYKNQADVEIASFVAAMLALCIPIYWLYSRKRSS